MKKNWFILSIIALFAMTHSFAGVPQGYYTTIDGTKHTTLKSALNTIISEHKILGYNTLWTYYPSTYYHLDNKSQVLDMYSNIVRYYNGTSAVTGMNKEHTVPKSWWGGSTAAAPGNDLYNVIPSDETANSRKSNYSLGIVSKASFTNDVTTVGTGSVNSYSATFFEPTDQYKGDFARIYFYMATCYPALDWDTNKAAAMTNNSKLTLQDWIIPMLIEWNNQDPVDEAEIQRNEDVFAIQGNRNPFIDYPVLVDYIWGGKTEKAFFLSEHKANEGGTSVMYAGIPKFSLNGGTSTNPKNVTTGTTITIKGSSNQAMLYTRVNDGTWTETQPTTAYYTGEPTKISAETKVDITDDCRIQAYCTQPDRENSDTLDYYYKVVDYSTDYLLYEDFISVTSGNNTSSTGSSTTWEGNDNFPTVTTAYTAGNAIKLGSGKNNGSIVSKTLDFAGGTLNIRLGVKGWTSIEGDINVSVTGSPTQKVSYTAKMSDSFETIDLTFNDVSANPQVTISTSSKRAFINLVAISQSQSSDISSPSVSIVRYNDAYYSISGQRINVKPSRPGIYLYNGRKVVIK